MQDENQRLHEKLNKLTDLLKSQHGLDADAMLNFLG